MHDVSILVFPERGQMLHCPMRNTCGSENSPVCVEYDRKQDVEVIFLEASDDAKLGRRIIMSNPTSLDLVANSLRIDRVESLCRVRLQLKSKTGGRQPFGVVASWVVFRAHDAPAFQFVEHRSVSLEKL